MPNNGIRIYTENGKGIDVRNDLYRFFGVSPRRNGYDIGYICTNEHGKINKWAKYKPEAAGSASKLTLQQRKSNNFGLRPARVYNTCHAFEDAVAAGELDAEWRYIAPGAGYFKRAGDFDGYDHGAVCPFGTLSEQTMYLTGDASGTVELAGDDLPTTKDDATWLTMDDFENVDYPLKDWYFGVCLYNRKEKRFITATQPIPVGQSQTTDIDIGFVPTAHEGNYEAYTFLCEGRVNAGGVTDGNTRTVGLSGAAVTVKLLALSNLYGIEAKCWFRSAASNVVEYSISITNRAGTSRTLPNLSILLAKDSQGTDSVTFHSFGSVTIGSMETWHQSGMKSLEGYGSNPASVFGYFTLHTSGSELAGLAWWPMDEDVVE